MGRYNLTLLPSKETATELWHRVYESVDRIADFRFSGIGPDQPWQITDTRKNEIISKEKYFQIVSSKIAPLMSKEEIALKVVVGKRIVEEMLTGDDRHFWKSLINNRQERFFLTVQAALERLPYPGRPKTDQDVADLIFKWTLPMRSAVITEFNDDIEKALDKRPEVE